MVESMAVVVIRGYDAQRDRPPRRSPLPCPSLPLLPHAVSLRMRRSTIIMLIKMAEMVSGPEKEIVGLVHGCIAPWPEATLLPCYYPHLRSTTPPPSMRRWTSAAPPVAGDSHHTLIFPITLITVINTNLIE
nr:PREDICTED: uncharacterized protein LOC108951707 [Musa acuminata subsp. malaccensis]